MTIAFTKSNSVLSKLIRWVFNEPCSHVVFVFDDKFVIHSNLLGLQFNWFKSFKKKNEIVEQIKMHELTTEKEEEVYQGLLEEYDGCEYDFKAFWYFAYHALMFKLFKKPMPKLNPKNASGFLCTEIYGTLPEWLVPKVNKDLSIITPYQLFKSINEALK